VPAADHFPPADLPVDLSEVCHPLAMDLCAACGLAQLAEDDTDTAEPRGVEPQALKDQAAEAVRRVADAGWLNRPGGTVREFGSPHGGSWLPLLGERRYRSTCGGTADVVLDCFGIMHDADQQAAFEERARATAPDGVLLLQFHSLAAIVAHGQWNSLRHGHFAYYSTPVVVAQLDRVGMRAAHAWTFDLYGGTVLVAAVHGTGEPGPTVGPAQLTRASLSVQFRDEGADLEALGCHEVLDRFLGRKGKLHLPLAAGVLAVAAGGVERDLGVDVLEGLHVRALRRHRRAIGGEGAGGG
jgi:SAM-dependent methyltransferase